MLSKGETTKQRILDEATEVFQCKGFHATSVNDLVKATGVTKGSLYFHFSGKDAVGIEVLRREAELFMQFLDGALVGDTPAACLDNFFKEALRKHQKKNFVGGCLFGNTALEASDTSPAYTQIIDAVFDEWIRKVQNEIARAQQMRLIRQDISPSKLAKMVVATIEGGIMQSRLKKSADPMRQCLDILRTVLNLKL